MKPFPALLALSISVSVCGAVVAQDTSQPMVIQGNPSDTRELGLSLVHESRAAIDRSVKWLLEQQNEDGHWSNPDFPALTALPLWALAKSAPENKVALDKAVNVLLSSVHDDGSIWRSPSVKQKGGGLANYNTAVCMVALNAIGDPRLIPVVQKARQFIAGTQHLGADDDHGGMGYDPETGKPYADLSNSYMAYEAMRLTENVEDQRKTGDARADLDWKAAREFLSKIQNKSSDTNDDNAGGFAYHPSDSKAGVYTNVAGELRFRSYGSMTYAGLLSLIYADVNKRDARVTSAFDWAAKHWTLDENPGVGADGLYYFYNVLSKALAVYGQDRMTTGAGQTIHWRAELIKKLIHLQKIDPKTGGGYWVNDSGRWWESDPVLVTAYSLLALEIASNP